MSAIIQLRKNTRFLRHRHIGADHRDQRDQGEDQRKQGFHAATIGSANARIVAVTANDAIMVFSIPVLLGSRRRKRRMGRSIK